ncbi:MAG: ATP-dependent 6-phosphofructokinase [Mycoplasmoidaceae bacterium]
MKSKKFAILTSGGDSSSMNKVLSTFVRTCILNEITPYFVYDGFEGLYKNKIKKASLKDVHNVWNLPGTLIKSSRFPQFKEEAIRKVAYEHYKRNEIDCLFVCGGNGSYIGAEKLSNLGANVVGLPGTIDNDIASSEFTIGFDTSLNSIKNDLVKIRATMESHGFITIVEIMGRDCLDLTLYAAIASEANFIITNENILSKEEILNVVKDLRKTNKGAILILVSELIYGKNGLPSLAEVAAFVTEHINEKIRLNILGYTQRAGIPSAFDLILATKLTEAGIDLALKGVYNIVIGNKGQSIVHLPINKANNLKTASKIKEIEKFNKGK